MSDRPILFSGPMVRCIIQGRKTQTRRVLTEPYGTLEWTSEGWRPICLKFFPGDRLWVREAWHAARSLDRTPPRDISRDASIEHAATARSYAEIGLKGKLRPGIFLPRWASRLTLVVTDVRVQRLKDIKADDCRAEGCRGGHESIPGYGFSATPLEHFRHLWDSLNARRAPWDSNPWVCAVTFTAHHSNIDQMPEGSA